VILDGKGQVLFYGSTANRGSTGLLAGNFPADYRRKGQNWFFVGFAFGLWYA